MLTKGGRRSQIQTTSPTIRYRPHITPIEQIRGVGSHKGGRNAGVYETSTTPRHFDSIELGGFEVLVLTKGG